MARRRIGILIGAVSLSCMFVANIDIAHAAECIQTHEVKLQEWSGDVINIVPWVAEDQGFFRRNCIHATFVPLVSGPGSYAGMVSGAINFANGAPDGIMRSRAQGVDLKLIGNMYAAQWSSLVGRNGLSLPHGEEGYPAIMQDLAGKKIGVTVLGGTTEAYVRSCFEGAGLSGSSPTMVAVGGIATAIAALKNGVVDAAMTGGKLPELAEALGAGKIILDLRKRGVGPSSLRALYGATLSWAAYGPFIDKNQETVAAFIDANNEAIKWITDMKNRNSLYVIMTKHMQVNDVPDPDVTLRRIVDVNASGLGIGVPGSSIDGWNKYLISLQQIKQSIPYNELVWKTGRI